MRRLLFVIMLLIVAIPSWASWPCLIEVSPVSLIGEAHDKIVINADMIERVVYDEYEINNYTLQGAKIRFNVLAQVGTELRVTQTRSTILDAVDACR